MSTSPDELTQAAAALRQPPLDESHPAMTAGTFVALADLLERVAEAWPIDHDEPPRHPQDRGVLLRAAYLAAQINRDNEGGELQ